MKNIETVLTTTATYSDDESKRYLLRKVWDSQKPSLAVIMLVPSEASGIELDNTTMLVLNNASRLGYGSVSIVNLFATLGDFRLSCAENEDSENIKTILGVAETADTVVYAAGVGKATNKSFVLRQDQVLMALKPYESKLKCLVSYDGKNRYQHPLSPKVRNWRLAEMKASELISADFKSIAESKKRKK